jgi:MYXO-CTERM domain-containing protein
MKKIAITILSTLLFTLGSSFTHIDATPAFEKQVVVGDENNGNGNNFTRTAANADADNDTDYGWLGLLGLIGLAGLRSRDRAK